MHTATTTATGATASKWARIPAHIAILLITASAVVIVGWTLTQASISAILLDVVLGLVLLAALLGAAAILFLAIFGFTRLMADAQYGREHQLSDAQIGRDQVKEDWSRGFIRRHKAVRLYEDINGDGVPHVDDAR